MSDVRNLERHSTAVELFGMLTREGRRPTGTSPWVMANMVSSLDGRASIGGRSGRLGGPLDRVMFQAIRALADVIIVGAQTIRTERYGPIRLPDELQEVRHRLGRPAQPTLAVLSGSLGLPENTGLTEVPERLWVLTSPTAPAERKAALVDLGVTVVTLEGARPTGVEALEALGSTGATVVLTEGGPGLLGALTASLSIDELCLTLAPRLLGTGIPLLERPDLGPDRWTLDRGWAADDDLFLRYLRADTHGSPAKQA